MHVLRHQLDPDTVDPDQRTLNRERLYKFMSNRHAGCVTSAPTQARSYTPHRVGEDACVRGFHIPEGRRITLLLGAANRDPALWERPNEFDVSRKKLPHLGFAFGLHSCVGMNLARLEAQIFLQELIDVLPDWTIAEPLDYGTNYTVRGPTDVLVSAA